MKLFTWHHLLFGLALAGSAVIVAAEDLPIGQAVVTSGVFGDTGKDLVLGARIYFDYVNDNGGINGNRIRHIVKDDQFKPVETVRALHELIDKDRVVALIGSAGGVNIATALQKKVLQDAGIAMVAPYSGAPQIRAPFAEVRNLFHIRASTNDEIDALLRQLDVLNIDRVAAFYFADPAGKLAYDHLVEALKARNKTLVAAATFRLDAVDDLDEAVKTIAKANPSAVIMLGTNKPIASFIKKARQAAVAGQLLTWSAVDPHIMHEQAGEEALRGLGVSQVMPFPYTDAVPVVREYRRLLKKYAPDASPSYASLEQFIGAKVLVEAIRRAGPRPTRESVFKALEGLGKYDAGGFQVAFSPNSHAGSGFVEVTVVERNGRLMH